MMKVAISVSKVMPVNKIHREAIVLFQKVQFYSLTRML